MSRHIFMMVAACAAVIFTVQPASADSILNDLMPSVFGKRTQGPKPEDTLIAPFAQNAQGTRKAGQVAEDVRHDTSISIDSAHRSDKAVSDWAVERTVMGLSYDPSDAVFLKSRMADLTAGFGVTGLQDLDAALAKMNVPQALINNRQKIATFTKSAPTVTYSGNQYGGVYRWLIDVPVALSVMPVGLKDYRTANAATAASVSTTPLTIRVQIGRVIGDTAHPDGMVIERFTVMAPSS